MLYLAILISTNAFSYLSSIYLSKELSVNSYSEIVLLITVSSFLSTISLLGRSELALRTISQSDKKVDFSSILSSLCLCVVLVFFYSIISKYNIEFYFEILILSSISIITAFSSTVLKVKKSIILLGLTQKVNNIYKIIIFFVVCFAGVDNSLLAIAMLILAIIYFVFFSFNLVYSKEHYNFRGRGIEIYERKAIPFLIDGFSFLLYYQSSILIFGYLNMNYELAVYSLALLPVSGYSLIFNAYFNSLVLSKFYSLAAKSTKNARFFLVENIKKQILVIPFVIITYLFLTMFLFDYIFDSNKYPDLVWLSSSLVFVVSIKFFTSSLNMFMNLEDNIKLKNVICVSSGIVHSVLSIIFIKCLGLFGAAISSIVSELIILVFYIVVFKRKVE